MNKSINLLSTAYQNELPDWTEQNHLPFSTYFTREWFLASVVHFVFLEVRRVSERLVTLVALVDFLRAVLQHLVRLQLVDVTVRHVTEPTLVLLLPRVSHHVTLQLLRIQESFFTNFTSVRFQAYMSLLMLF